MLLLQLTCNACDLDLLVAHMTVTPVVLSMTLRVDRYVKNLLTILHAVDIGTERPI